MIKLTYDILKFYVTSYSFILYVSLCKHAMEHLQRSDNNFQLLVASSTI